MNSLTYYKVSVLQKFIFKFFLTFYRIKCEKKLKKLGFNAVKNEINTKHLIPVLIIAIPKKSPFKNYYLWLFFNSNLVKKYFYLLETEPSFIFLIFLLYLGTLNNLVFMK